MRLYNPYVMISVKKSIKNAFDITGRSDRFVGSKDVTVTLE